MGSEPENSFFLQPLLQFLPQVPALTFLDDELQSVGLYRPRMEEWLSP